MSLQQILTPSIATAIQTLFDVSLDKVEFQATRKEFEGDITVKGEIITGSRNLHGEIILISLKNCTVTHGENILFRPEWGNYDMAVGKKVVSAFSGPADVNSFDLISHVPSSKTIKAKHTAERDDLELLYHSVRKIRETKDTTTSLEPIFKDLKIDRITKKVFRDNKEIKLGPIEYKLLDFFIKSPQRVYSREQLLNNVWGENMWIYMGIMLDIFNLGIVELRKHNCIFSHKST